MKKTYRIKTNNQELLIRKQNESDATSRWIEFQKTRPIEDFKIISVSNKKEKEKSMEDWMLLGRLVAWPCPES